MRGPNTDLKPTILDRMTRQETPAVWTPIDFLDVGSREAVDQALHRLVASKDIRRIARGLYDKPSINQLTGKATSPDYRQVIDALGRRDQVRIVVDGITAANDLGLTDAVPARAVVLTDARLRPIDIGNLKIVFHHAAPSRLHWAGHPAMRIVQALYWLRDMLPADEDRILKRLLTVLQDPKHGQAIQDDLKKGLPTLPTWMQRFIRKLLKQAKVEDQPESTDARPGSTTLNEDALPQRHKIKRKAQVRQT